MSGVCLELPELTAGDALCEESGDGRPGAMGTTSAAKGRQEKLTTGLSRGPRTHTQSRQTGHTTRGDPHPPVA